MRERRLNIHMYPPSMAPIVAAKGMASGIGKRSTRTDSLKDVLVPLAREAGEGIGMAEACGVSQEGGWRQYNAKGGNRQDIGGGGGGKTLTVRVVFGTITPMKQHGHSRVARPNKHTAFAEARREASPSRPVVSSLDEGALREILEKEPSGLYLVLDCIQDPHNLGAILRTADGAGVAAVIAPKDKSASITETVLRVSVGAAEKVPFVQVTNLARTMKEMKEAGLWFVGTSDHGDRDLYDMDMKGGIALVMGAEGSGMRRLTEENCDFLVRIPMQGAVPCLNVSVATGVCLYEALRQRR